MTPLTRWPNDRTLRGHNFVHCCDCDLVHLHVYEVVRTGKREWCLIRRAIRVPDDVREKCVAADG